MKDFFSRLTWVDYIAVLALVRGCYVGYKSGLFPEILRIISYLLSVTLAVQFFLPLAELLTLQTFLNDATAKAIAFGGILVLSLILAKLLSFLLLKVLKVGQGGLGMRVFGMALGAARWILLLSLFFMLIEHVPAPQLQKDVKTRSVSGPAISSIAPAFFDFLSSVSPQLGLPDEKTASANANKTKPAAKGK